MKRYIPFLGDRKARKAWEKLFSREVLGAVLVGSAVGKVVENALKLTTTPGVDRLLAWIGAAVAFVLLFVLWHRLSDVKDAAEEVVETEEK